MDETSLVDIKIKPEVESSDDSSIGSDIVYSMTEPPFPEVVTQQDSDEEPVHVLRESPEVEEAAGTTCMIKVRKRKKGSFLTPTAAAPMEEDCKDHLIEETSFLNTEEQEKPCLHEHLEIVPKKRGRKKKVPGASPPPPPPPLPASSKPKAHCRFCTMHTPSKRGRKRGRTGSRSLKCKFCSMVMPDADHLRKHERAHGMGQRLKCRYCIKTFSAYTAMREHERTHTGERPFKCQYCKKGFTTTGAVKVHERTHTGERPFKCKLCKKTFATSGVLRAHVRYHTGEKPFKCKICPKAFAESGHLRRHERTHADIRNLHLHKDMYFVL